MTIREWLVPVGLALMVGGGSTASFGVLIRNEIAEVIGIFAFIIGLLLAIAGGIAHLMDLVGWGGGGGEPGEPGRFSGRVYYKSGPRMRLFQTQYPVPGAKVKLLTTGDEVETGSDGTFQFPNEIRPGKHRFTITHEPADPTDRTFQPYTGRVKIKAGEAAYEEIELKTLAPGQGLIIGKVVDADDNTPIEAAVVKWNDVDAQENPDGTGGEGDFHMVIPGTKYGENIAFTVEKPGYDIVDNTPTTVNDANRRVEGVVITLRKNPAAFSVFGQVTDHAGTPIDGVKVTLEVTAPAGTPGWQVEPSGPEGRYKITDTLPAGVERATVKLVVEEDDYNKYESAEFEIIEGYNEEHNIVLEKAQLGGVVLEESGPGKFDKRVEGAEVVLINAKTKKQIKGIKEKTDANGFFNFRNAPFDIKLVVRASKAKKEKKPRLTGEHTDPHGAPPDPITIKKGEGPVTHVVVPVIDNREFIDDVEWGLKRFKPTNAKKVWELSAGGVTEKLVWRAWHEHEGKKNAKFDAVFSFTVTAAERYSKTAKGWVSDFPVDKKSDLETHFETSFANLREFVTFLVARFMTVSQSNNDDTPDEDLYERQNVAENKFHILQNGEGNLEKGSIYRGAGKNEGSFIFATFDVTDKKDRAKLKDIILELKFRLVLAVDIKDKHFRVLPPENDDRRVKGVDYQITFK